MTEIHKKGWGYENWLVNNELYCGKILHFNKGKQCSLHYHKIKDETFYVLKGEALLQFVNDDGKIKTKIFRMGDSFHIPPNMAHRIIAETGVDIIEISTQHFEEDSYRIEKGD